MRPWIACVIAFATLCGSAQAARIEKPGRVEVELVADDAPRTAGRPVRVGLRMKMDAGWHTYWKNPGDAGMPTQVRWTLPPGWSGGDIEWPAPERIPVGSLASYGYEGEVVLPMLLFVPRDWDGRSVKLAAEAEWLVCKESCLPEKASLTMDLAGTASGTAASRALFDTARARQPHAVRWEDATVARDAGRLELRLKPATRGQFFPDAEELVEPGDPPKVTVDGRTATWSAKLGQKGKALASGSPVRGVWVPESGTPLIVDAVVRR